MPVVQMTGTVPEILITRKTGKGFNAKPGTYLEPVADFIQLSA